MSDIKPNLEPIEENDLNLEKKFGVAGDQQKENSVVEKVEKEIPQEIVSAEKDATYNKILSKVQTVHPVPNDDDVKKDAQKVSEKTDSESQIQHLVDLAQQKGVVHAVKVARHFEDNYVLDQFHDKLMADELHSALLQKGLIKDM
jgi:hypothetical protein